MKYNNHKKYALFIGRWQPFHDGHKYIIDEVLEKGKDACIAIRDTELSDKNPYTYEQRAEMIRRVYGDKVRIIRLPDIESINIGRNVGYEVNRIDPPGDIAEISGTNIRHDREHRLPVPVSRYTKLLRTTIWLTGLPCSGKTTIALRLKEELDNRGYKSVHLDGDSVRKQINYDLGFAEADRRENLRRVAHMAKLFNDNGTIVIASFVSPTNELRAIPRGIVEHMQMVYLKCSVEECARRDVKGMYKMAMAGQIASFTGVSAPFEEPPGADIILDTEHNGVEECVKYLLTGLNV